MTTTPRPTAVALLATLVATATALALFLSEAPGTPGPYLLLFTVLFAVRVAGQLVVLGFHPAWLPPSEQWNLLAYPILLPAQLALLALMGAFVAGVVHPSPELAREMVPAAFVYWAAMGVRYAVRMARRPTQRWLGGAIPIVFHCVLAAFLFVLGTGGGAVA